MIVDKKTVNAVKVRLVNEGITPQSLSEVKKMLEIKQALLWRADNTPSCGSLFTVSAQLSREVDSLDLAMSALENGNIDDAIRALDEYERFLDTKGDWVVPGVCSECRQGKPSSR